MIQAWSGEKGKAEIWRHFPGPNLCEHTVSFCQLPSMPVNDPFGSRSEPGTHMTRKTHRPLPGEIPEGRAGVRPHSIGRCAQAHSEARA